MVSAGGVRCLAEVEVRPVLLDDASAFVRFAREVNEGERRFLKEDLDEPAEVFAGFLRESPVRHLVAVDDKGVILGLGGVFPGTGWYSHVAEIRVLVSAAHRRQGIGRRLAQGALTEVMRLGCTHAYVEVVAEQEELVSMFQDLGFEPAALLPDFVRDAEGEPHDLMVLTHSVDGQLGLNHLLRLNEVTR